jgi:hypothetical protein
MTSKLVGEISSRNRTSASFYAWLPSYDLNALPGAVAGPYASGGTTERRLERDGSGRPGYAGQPVGDRMID